MYYYTELVCELDRLYICSSNEKITSVFIRSDDFLAWIKNKEVSKDDHQYLLIMAKRQLMEYLEGKRKVFDLPITFEGTPFQLAVWNALLTIPYGETRSYQYIAEMIERPMAVRAVGQANRANNLPIIVPCHRVIGKNGKLTGYAGTQIHIKEKLLKIESNM